MAELVHKYQHGVRSVLCSELLLRRKYLTPAIYYVDGTTTLKLTQHSRWHSLRIRAIHSHSRVAPSFGDQKPDDLSDMRAGP